MFGIGYFKAEPTEFVRKVAGGRVKKEGRALSFYYLRRRTSIVSGLARSWRSSARCHRTGLSFPTASRPIT